MKQFATALTALFVLLGGLYTITDTSGRDHQVNVLSVGGIHTITDMRTGRLTVIRGPMDEDDYKDEGTEVLRQWRNRMDKAHRDMDEDN